LHQKQAATGLSSAQPQQPMAAATKTAGARATTAASSTNR